MGPIMGDLSTSPGVSGPARSLEQRGVAGSRTDRKARAVHLIQLPMGGAEAEPGKAGQFGDRPALSLGPQQPQKGSPSL